MERKQVMMDSPDRGYVWDSLPACISGFRLVADEVSSSRMFVPQVPRSMDEKRPCRAAWCDGLGSACRSGRADTASIL